MFICCPCIAFELKLPPPPDQQLIITFLLRFNSTKCSSYLFGHSIIFALTILPSVYQCISLMHMIGTVANEYFFDSFSTMQCRYMLSRASVPRHAIIKKLAGEDIAHLDDLIAVLSKLSRGTRVPLEYVKYTDRHRNKVRFE